ncbi:group II intron maturase-specific domain-containing protein [Bradyrhizobium sp. USDA 4529]
MFAEAECIPYPEQKFDFLGYTFRARRSKNRWGKHFVNFSPGVSNAATKAIRQEIRAWQLRCRVDKRIDDLARMFNPIIRGWMNYYGRYYKSALYPTLRHLDRCLARWAMSKYKRLRRHRRRAEHWVRDIACRTPTLLAIGRCCTRRRLDGKSRMSGDVHVRICERLGGETPPGDSTTGACRTEREAEAIRAELQARLEVCLRIPMISPGCTDLISPRIPR